MNKNEENLKGNKNVQLGEKDEVYNLLPRFNPNKCNGACHENCYAFIMPHCTR